MSLRTILRLHPAQRDDIADLVTRRPLPGPAIEHLDPFLFLNHHGPQVYPPNNRGLPFGPHPHRGFETVTFILEGELTHRDSGGHESVIHAGGAQWMTAGSGLVHAEVSSNAFKSRGGPLEILQLWVNLPPALKMTPPRYTGLQQPDIPVVPTPDGRGQVKLIAGEWQGRRGPVQPLHDVFMSIVELAADARAEFHLGATRNVFLYVVGGAVRIAGKEAPQHHLVELAPGGTLQVEGTRDATLLLGHAEPIGAPVVSHGPFVMNTRAEIEQAVRDYQAGRFGGL